MIGVCGDEKATALREFREAKASAARRAVRACAQFKNEK